MNIGGQMTEDAQFTKLTADLIMVARGFCEYGEDKGLLTPDGLRFAISNRKELARQLEQAGVSRSKIASLLGVSPATISYDLNGRPSQSEEKPSQSEEREPEDNWSDDDSGLESDESDEVEDQENDESVDPKNYRTSYLLRANIAMEGALDCAELFNKIRQFSQRIRNRGELIQAARDAEKAWGRLASAIEEELD
jgi:transcriptional regulator with XRE-family HTH domain